MALPVVILKRGTRAAQPVATDVADGVVYCVTDEAFILEQSVTGAWVPYSPTAGGAGAVGGLAAGTQTATSGTVVFSNSNGVTFGMSGSSRITASVSQSAQAASAGNGSFAFQTVSFSNANGISFSTTAGSGIVASHNGLTTQSGQAFSAGGGSSTFQTLSFRNANGISFSNSGGSVEASVAVSAALSVGLSTLGNTLGDTGVVTGRLVFVGSNNITLSGSTNAGSMTISISGGAGGGGGNTGSISAGTTRGTLGEVVFSDSNGVSFGMSGQTLTASVAPSAVGLAAVYDGANSISSGTVRLSNANGISFGVNGQTITASHDGLTTQSGQAFSAGGGSSTFQTLSFRNANGISFSNSGGSVEASYTVPTVPAQLSVGVSTGGNTSGDTGLVTGRVVFVGTNNITLSGSTNAGSMTISISGGAGAAGNTGYISAGGATASLGTVVFSNSNGVSFGVNGQTVTASYTVPTVPAQLSVGMSTNGNTSGDTGLVTGRLVLAGGNNITLSGSTNAGSMTISVSAANAVGQTNVAFSAGAASSTFQTLSFQDSNGVSFSNNAGAIRVTHALQFTSATSAITSNALNTSASRVINLIAATNSTGGGTASLSSNVSFSNLNGITFYTSAGNAIVITHDLQYTSATSAITSNALNTSAARVFNILAATNNTGGGTASLSSNVSFSNVNGATFYTSAGNAIALSYTVPTVPAQFSGGMSTGGNTSGDTGLVTGRLALAGGNNITLSGSTNAGSMTITISAPAAIAQTVQTLGLYALGNTTGQSSSSTYDARTLSIEGAGIVSVGWSNSSYRISATQSNQAFSAVGGSSAFQTLSFSDNAAASWTNTGGAVAIASVRASLYGTSNTTQGTSGTANLNSLIFAGAGIASVGVTGGSVVVSVPAGGGAGDGGVFAGVSTMGNTAGSTGTVSTGNFVLVGTGALTLSQSTAAAGSHATVTLSVPQTSSLSATGIVSISTNGSTISIGAAQTVLSAWEPYPIITGSNVSSFAPASYYFNRFVIPQPITITAVNVFGSVSAGAPGATSQNSTGTARYSYSRAVYLFKRQDWGANSTNLTYLTSGSFGLTAGLSYSSTSQSLVYSWVTNSTGGTSSFNTTSNATNWASYLTGNRLMQIPLVSSLSAGEYFIAHAHSSTTGTTQSNVTLLSVSFYNVVQQQNSVWLFGQGTTASSLFEAGMGAGSASAITTNNTMGANTISVGQRPLIYVNFSGS